jgi:hypothetical protein
MLTSRVLTSRVFLFEGLELEKRHEEELVELKLQLKQALAEEQQAFLKCIHESPLPLLRSYQTIFIMFPVTLVMNFRCKITKELVLYFLVS